LAGVGVRHVALTFQTATAAETLERMHRFAAEVMPDFKREAAFAGGEVLR